MPRTSRSAHSLTGHAEIRRWAEQRGARLACVRGTGGGEDVGMIRLDFPGYSGAESLQPIDWDEWFQKFDERNLALLVQDETARGQKSNFNKLVSRDTAEERQEMEEDRSSRSQGRNGRSRGRSARGRSTSRKSRSTRGTSRRSVSGSSSRRPGARRTGTTAKSSRSRRSEGRASRGQGRRSSSSAQGSRRTARSTRRRSNTSVRESSRRRAA